MTDAARPHIPVMLDEVLTALAPQSDGLYVDATFGRGGYTSAILEAAACRVAAIDRDPQAIAAGAALQERFPGRLTLLPGRFGDMLELLADAGLIGPGGSGEAGIDGVVFDLGVASPQIDDPARGFSFRFDGPLDMRMGSGGPTAADIVNEVEEGELADLIHSLGEERMARRVARAIVRARQASPITRTATLADIVRSAVPKSKDGIDPATRTFMALRLHVNDELGELDRGLVAAERALKEGGRLVAVAFHSLEDRRVKQFLQQRAGEGPQPSRHQPLRAADTRRPSFRLLRRGTIKPSEREAQHNPRARSARLRAAIRTEAPAWPAPANAEARA